MDCGEYLMPFTFKQCFTDDGALIEGLFEISPKVFADSRGYFFESYSQKDFNAAGLNMNFVQDNQSRSVRGVLRGLHFQKNYPKENLSGLFKGKFLMLLSIYVPVQQVTANGTLLFSAKKSKISFIFRRVSLMGFWC
jgi:hypothetical protein